MRIMPPRKRVKTEKRVCAYCQRPRAVSTFKAGEDTCNTCLVFDKAANVTGPKCVLVADSCVAPPQKP